MSCETADLRGRLSVRQAALACLNEGETVRSVRASRYEAGKHAGATLEKWLLMQSRRVSVVCCARGALPLHRPIPDYLLQHQRRYSFDRMLTLSSAALFSPDPSDTLSLFSPSNIDQYEKSQAVNGTSVLVSLHEATKAFRNAPADAS